MPEPKNDLKPAWKTKLLWPLAALALMLVFNLSFTEGFFRMQVEEGGYVSGSLVDILKNGSIVMLLSLGMTLVIATGGVDLSVGAVMAISGAVAAMIVNQPDSSFAVAVLAALGVSLLAGIWNGILIGGFRIQPIVATLILMVAGRGVAQLITDGQIITFHNEPFEFLANGHSWGAPFPVWIVVIMFAATMLWTRKTAWGLFIECVGDNERASYFAGINSRAVKFIVYAFSGLCAGIAGLLAASNIKGADSIHAGLTLELDAIVAVVIGGTALTGGRFFLAGSIIGALIIQTLTTTMYAKNVSSDVVAVPKALVILGVCLLQSPIFRRQIAQLGQLVGIGKRRSA
jgi:ribose/xylose/arabinose/galactoside ABC-type transport system permease subunit